MGSNGSYALMDTNTYRVLGHCNPVYLRQVVAQTSSPVPWCAFLLRLITLLLLCFAWFPYRSTAAGQGNQDSLQGPPCIARSKHQLSFARVWVNKDLAATNKEGTAFGSCFAYEGSGSYLYPGILDANLHGLYTTDVEFRRGSTHLLDGRFESKHKNGLAKMVLVFRQGFLLSWKQYDKKGDLIDWVDHEVDLDGCAYTSFFHGCVPQNGRLATFDYICTCINGRYKCYAPEEFWEAKRKGLLSPAGALSP